MFLSEAVSSPVIVDGRKFFDRTINSQFKCGNVSITTTYMDGKPLIKKYMFCGNQITKNVWKSICHNNDSRKGVKLNIIV